MAMRFAPTDLPVLIIGETGTGKEKLARYIHKLSLRPGALVEVDCGALPDQLVDSLLLGHVKGAFTGASENHVGLIEEANGGTLFLDELGNLPSHAQTKLLRVLETGSVRPIGGGRSKSVSFRLIATAQTDISARTLQGGFRLDLMQRVAGAVIRLPTLAERREDVRLLARHFAEQTGKRLTTCAEDVLIGHSWRGNVRELRWTVLRASHFALNGEISSQSVRAAWQAGPEALFEARQDKVSDRHTELSAVCSAYNGDANRIAGALGIGKSTLYRWLQDAELELRSFRRGGAISARPQ
jgi:two-component system response regulator GlrR